MSVSGSIYGVVLNDRREREALAGQFLGSPYGAPPEAPVVYVRPRACLASRVAQAPAGGAELEAAATLALLFGRDACKVSKDKALDAVAASALALDLAAPQENYYRPAVAQRCGDGLLPLGRFGPPVASAVIETVIDGQLVHQWSLDRLVRPAAELIADLSAFMTLRAGDLLLVGLPGDPPRAQLGQTIQVRAAGLATLKTLLAETQP